VFAVPAPTLASATDAELAFLWDATLQGAADLKYIHWNESVYTGDHDKWRQHQYTLEGFGELVERKPPACMTFGFCFSLALCWWCTPSAVVRQQNIIKYGQTDAYLYQALSRYPLTGKRVLIIGSETPTYEAVAIAYGAESVRRAKSSGLTVFV
jgi:hypothetical protein